MVEEERAEKQSYLIEEVINKGHDPDAFMSFCETRKGADIDLWTMTELRQCVKDFQESLLPKPASIKSFFPTLPTSTNTATKVQTSSEFQTSPTKTEPEPKAAEVVVVEEVKQEIVETVKEVPKEDKFVINCIKQEPNQLSSCETVTFEILEPILVKGGFFTSDYHLFPVNTSPLGWSCKRRFSEFLWLREVLSTTLLGTFIPPIPTRKSRQGTPESILHKKKKIIIRFTSGIARNKFILSSPIVESFFKITDVRDFSDFQKKIKKSSKKPENPEFAITATGTAQCDVTFPGQRPEKLAEYAAVTESIEKKLKRHASSVMNDIKAVEAEFIGLSELIKQYAELQDMLPYGEGLMRLYTGLSECLQNLGAQESSRCETFEEYFNMYFKYTYLEKEVMKNMLKERESAFNEFVAAEAKKKNVDKTRNFYGFLNYSTIEEVERVIAENSMLMNKHFLQLANEELQSTTNLHSLWTKFIESIDSI